MSDVKITAALQSQNNAYVAEMSAALQLAQVRWAQVFDTYSDAWESGWEGVRNVLVPIGTRRRQQIMNERALLGLAMDVAVVIALNAGGASAIRLAPIATARASLLKNYLTKEWTTSVDALGRSLGSRAADLAKAPQKYLSGKLENAEKGAKEWILDKLCPLKTAEETVKLTPLPNGASPKTIANSFKESSRLENERLASWVLSLAHMNAERDVRAIFIPLARDALLASAWVSGVPDVKKTQECSPLLAEAIELALWMRWIRGLDKQYWYDISQRYRHNYATAGTPPAKRAALLQDIAAFSPLIEFAPVAARLTRLDPYYSRYTVPMMSSWVMTGPNTYPPDIAVLDISRLQLDSGRLSPVRRRFRRLGASTLALHALAAMGVDKPQPRQDLSPFWREVIAAANSAAAR